MQFSKDRIFSISAHIRSGAMSSIRSAFAFAAARHSISGEKPVWAQILARRISLNPSAEKTSPASLTVETVFLSISSTPPKGSTSSPEDMSK